MLKLVIRGCFCKLVSVVADGGDEACARGYFMGEGGRRGNRKYEYHTGR